VRVRAQRPVAALRSRWIAARLDARRGVRARRRAAGRPRAARPAVPLARGSCGVPGRSAALRHMDGVVVQRPVGLQGDLQRTLCPGRARHLARDDQLQARLAGRLLVHPAWRLVERRPMRGRGRRWLRALRVGVRGRMLQARPLISLIVAAGPVRRATAAV
jgi:hypothetical protein